MLLELKGITKSFPGVKALAGVDLALRVGEIHALMGENGAGKSTLIKVLTGVYRRDGGTMVLDGKPIDPKSPREAQSAGISTVYQEVNLIPHLSVAENITLGRQPKKFGVLDWREIHRRATEALRRMELTLDVGRPVSSYPLAIQQMVAIARSLDISCKLLILDEPTSSLDAKEVAQLFAVMRRLKAQGIGILFVTHFLDQVYAVTDRITVLRNGQRVGEYETKELPRLELVARMIGRELGQAKPNASSGAAADAPPKEAMAEAKGLGLKGSVEPFDLRIGKGEVVGLAGLLGSGRTEVARLFFGIDQPDSGRLLAEGRETPLSSPRRAIDAGFAYCSEDRKTQGIVPNLSVRENIVLALQATRGWFRHIPPAEQRAITEKYIKALNIATSDAEKPIKFLSGGNQQKALLGRWLATYPKLLILDEPTRGIDVGAKFEIEKLISQLVAEGMAILFISSELEEVVRNSHRVAVMRDRRKVAELSGGEIEESRVMRTIAGAAEGE